MGRRPVVLFWGSTAAAVMFLGTAWAAAGRSGPADVAVFVVSLAGFLITGLVAGRIAFVAGRIQKRRRSARSRPQ